MPNPNVSDEMKDYLMGAYQISQQWKLPYGRGDWESSSSSEIQEAAVIGGGTMGRGIAIALCRAGFKTMLVENNEKAKEWCLKELEITYAREKKLKRYNDEKIKTIRGQMEVTCDLNKLADCDLVIEAIFETMQLKKELFTKLDNICKPSCIFGTNTSSLNVDEMSSVVRDKSRLVGIHFFNPAHVIKVVEIVYGKYTSATSVATAFEACRAMKKVAVLVGNCTSFVFNRLLAVYLTQAQKLAYQYGLLPQHIDKIITTFGFLMGPLTMADMNGLDVMEKLKKENNVEFTPIEVELLERKRYGRKTNKGYYKYDEKTHKKENDMEVETIIRKISADSRVNIQLVCDMDVVHFLLLPMVNEGYLCIEEGIIEEERLIDIMFSLGFGWPPSYGGPMKYGTHIGIRKVADTISLWNSMEPNDRVYKVSKTLRKAAGRVSKI